jgi:protein kinase-like protein
MDGERAGGRAGSAIDGELVLGGRYRLIDQVGSGGMAVVWRAHDTVLGRTVAVKVLAAHYTDDPESRALIRQEARSAAAISHPNIAQVHDYGEAKIEDRTIPYVVMELIRGGTLQQRLNDGPVLPGLAMRICAEVAAALAAAHAEGLVHRDIKPANVMLAPTGAKVVDFGIAAAIKPPGPGNEDLMILGTPAYLAPERLLHDAVEPASDVYALGVLLYRLLTGRSPWTSETTTQMLTAHIYVDPAPLMPMFKVPDHVTALCNRCLSKDPGLRPSAREAAALLAHGAGLHIVTDEPAPATGAAAIDPDPSVLIRPPAAGPPGGSPGALGGSAGAFGVSAGAIAGMASSAAGAAHPHAGAAGSPAGTLGSTAGTAVTPGLAHDASGHAHGTAGSAHDTAGLAYGAAGLAHGAAGSAHDAPGAAHDTAGLAHDTAGTAHGAAGSAVGSAGSAQDVVASGAGAPPPAGDGPGTVAGATGERKDRRRFRPRHAVVGAALLTAGAAGWLLRPTGPIAVTSAPPPATTGSAPLPAQERRQPGGPATASGSTGPASAVRTTGARIANPGTSDGPTQDVTGPAVPVPAGTGPAATRPAAPGPDRTAPATAGPAPGPTTDDPDPPATATQPTERTLSSSAGSVRATCPDARTARILSWTAARSYQVVEGDSEAGPAPAVTFKHGNTQLTMTVTCSSGVPSASTS